MSTLQTASRWYLAAACVIAACGGEDTPPQDGVDASAGSFPRASGAPAGIVDNGGRSTRAMPVVTTRQPR